MPRYQFPNGEKNRMWKGDKVGIKSLHLWVKRHLPQPPLCQLCNLFPPDDLANVTGIYSRDLSNWKYFCEICHNQYDGTRWRKDMSDRCCAKCGSSKTYVNKRGYADWRSLDDQFICNKCYSLAWWHKRLT